MSGNLTEEQRQRIQINRHRALQKKIQRQQLQNGYKSVESFDYNEVSSGNNPPTSSYNQANKRKLESPLHIESDHIRCSIDDKSYMFHGVNSTDHAYHSNKTEAHSKYTEDQKIRMEKNRLIALEKKKHIVINSTTDFITHRQTVEQVSAAPSFPVQTHSITAHFGNESNMICSSRHTIKQQSAFIEPDIPNVLDTKQQAALHNERSEKSVLTKEQRAMIEQKRMLALQKKQSSFLNTKSNDKVKCVSVANSQCKPTTILTEQQLSLIEKKRLAALQKKQSRIDTASFSSSVQQTNEPKNILSENQKSFCHDNLQHGVTNTCFMSGAQQAARSTETPQKEQSYVEFVNHAGTLTEQQRVVIEKKRLAALQKKQSSNTSFEEVSNGQNHLHQLSVSNTDHIQMPSDKACTSEETAQQHHLKVSATAVEQCTKKQVQSSPNEGNQKEDGLPNIPADIQYERLRCRPIEDEYSDILIENAELDQPLLNGWSLYDHQKEGVLRALRMRRLILAFDMGLGKTIIGCVWSKAFVKTYPGIKVFVIAPVSLMEDWSRTSENATGLNTQGGKKKTTKNKSNKKSSNETGKENAAEINMYIFSWSSVTDSKRILVENPSDYVVICDEAHNMQSMESKRTVDALKLILGKKCQGVLLLSGTPMKNGKPSNLFPLLKAVKHPFGDNQKKYEFFFCNGQYRFMNRREVWDASGSSNLIQLHAHTSSHIFRKTKDECMSDELHPKRREYLEVPVSSRQEIRYKQALKELATAYNAMQMSKGEIGYNLNDHNILEPFNKLRQASSFAKIDAAVGIAQDILQEEGSIVIFTSFVGVAREIKQKLENQSWTGQLLTGEVVAHKRQKMVDEFQCGVTPVFVCTYGAGGVGLTLTAACTVILVDRPWTPGDVNQAEDRVRRIGQTRPVRSIWIQAFPIDKQIDCLIDHKEENTSTAVDGKTGTGGKNKAAPKISISELVKTALGNPESIESNEHMYCTRE